MICMRPESCLEKKITQTPKLHNLLHPPHIHQSPPKSPRNSFEPTLFNLRQKHIMLVRQPLIVPPYLPDDPMFLRTVRTLRFMFCYASITTTALFSVSGS